jgi:hypothetical protein
VGRRLHDPALRIAMRRPGLPKRILDGRRRIRPRSRLVLIIRLLALFRYVPPRPLAEIDAEIRALEEEIQKLLGEVTA